MPRLIVFVAFLSMVCPRASLAQDDVTRLPTESLEQAAGMKGAYDPAARVFKIWFPAMI